MSDGLSEAARRLLASLPDETVTLEGMFGTAPPPPAPQPGTPVFVDGVQVGRIAYPGEPVDGTIEILPDED